MRAPWKGPLRLECETGWADIYDDGDTPVLMSQKIGDEELFSALVHRANAYPKLLALLQRWVDEAEDGDLDRLVGLYDETRAALASTREEG